MEYDEKAMQICRNTHKLERKEESVETHNVPVFSS